MDTCKSFVFYTWARTSRSRTVLVMLLMARILLTSMHNIVVHDYQVAIHSQQGPVVHRHLVRFRFGLYFPHFHFDVVEQNSVSSIFLEKAHCAA